MLFARLGVAASAHGHALQRAHAGGDIEVGRERLRQVPIPGLRTQMATPFRRCTISAKTIPCEWFSSPGCQSRTGQVARYRTAKRPTSENTRRLDQYSSQLRSAVTSSSWVNVGTPSRRSQIRANPSEGHVPRKILLRSREHFR
jgi:hypothetical protein